ncbi:MAG TPA: O-antigen ligase family protein [Solirubrobacteraceae bacterium]|nr:O-antigen ligase family protein [Solirubrobacteraceae bacterium]
MRLSVGFAMACALAYMATPYAISLADRLQFYDKPAGYKGHARSTPYLGGAPVMAGFIVAVLLAAGSLHKTVPLIGGVTLLWLVGTIDDRRTVSPGLRVLLELGLAAFIWAVGLGWHLHMGFAVDLGLTCLWVLGVVNAFNLFDNMDGAAGTMALVVSGGAALIGIVRGDVWLAVGAASLGGACLGFLPRNLSLPARIFLGDGGSMPLGFAAAVLVMVAAGTSTVAWQSLLVALLLVGIPALDTSLVIVSRRRRGVPLLTGGRDHLTHRASRFLPSARAVALCLGAVQALVSVTAVLASQGGSSLVVISASVYLLAAACAIVLLEAQQVEEFGTPARASSVASAPSGGLSARAIGCLLVLGLGAGLSPFFFAYYNAAVWVPIGLGLTVACAIGVIARPIRPTLPAGLAAGGLLGIGIWSLGSTAWAESVESAVVSGNRWLAYGVLLLLMLVLLRGERRAAVLLGAVGVGVGVVALSVLARLLGDDPGALFLGGRLNAPLGYINGEGCLFVMGFWLCIAAAESRRALFCGPAAAMATLMACLALLSQSRGTAVAMLCSLIAVVAFAPGRTRRVYGLLAVAAGVALATPELLHVYSDTAAGSVSPGVGHAAGRAALLASLGVGTAWAALTGGWELSGASEFRGARQAGAWLLVLPALVALAVAIGSAHRIGRDVRTQWDSFTHLAAPAGSATSSATQSRLLSGAGNRYDYWRVAWRVWKDHPLLGVGAGNYPRGYYQLRATTEDIEQPHSVELQSLAELGFLGLSLFACFILGAAWGAARIAKRARRNALSRGLMVGALGALVAWLAQTSVDWMHLLPGLTAIAIAGAAVLVSPRLTGGPEEEPARDRPAPSGRGIVRASAADVSRPRIGAFHGRLAAAVGGSMVLATLVVAGASLSRQGLADFYRARAERELDGRPAAALTDASRSLAIDADAVQSYYVKASALARFNQGAGAERMLRAALKYEPGNYVTWALLGDVAVREGRLSQAKSDYMRAHQLNPLNSTLSKLAAHSGAALP